MDISTYECENQMSLFGDKRSFKIANHIRLIELFGGIGAQAAALRNIGADFEHYRMCEIDKFAVKSYNAIHGTNFEPTDIRKLTGKDLGIAETDKYTYIMTYSFPCVDLSRAGKGLGMQKGSGTRSGLLWEVERLLKECTDLPQILLMENVPQVHSEKNRADFEMWLDFLKGLGYSNFWKDLNAKEYGMAQNRNRCYVVSILGDYTYTFPDKVPLEKDAYAYLEDDVDEKYYLKSETAQKLVDNLEQKRTIARAEQSRAEQSRAIIDLSIVSPRARDIVNCVSARTNRGVSFRPAEGTGVYEPKKSRQEE